MSEQLIYGFQWRASSLRLASCSRRATRFRRAQATARLRRRVRAPAVYRTDRLREQPRRTRRSTSRTPMGRWSPG